MYTLFCIQTLWCRFVLVAGGLSKDSCFKAFKTRENNYYCLVEIRRDGGVVYL